MTTTIRDARWRFAMPALFVAVAAAYGIGAELSWHTFAAGGDFAFFPPAGVTLAALLLVRDRSRWPVVVAAAMLMETVVDLGHQLSLPVALGYAAANGLEPVVGALAVLYLRPGGPDLTRRPDVMRFLAGACVIGPMAGALIGATVKAIDAGGAWPSLALQWWAGDGLAVLVVGAPLLLGRQRWRLLSSQRLQAALLAAVTILVSIVSFTKDVPPGLLILPVIVAAAFGFGDIGVVGAGSLFAFVANYMTAAGYGTFADMNFSSGTRLALAQAFIAMIILVGWVVALEVDDRVRAVEEREVARDDRERAETMRAAAQLGDLLADAYTASSIGRRVARVVRARLGADYVGINALRDDGHTFQGIGDDGVPYVAAISSGRWTIDSMAPGAVAVRERSPVYVKDGATLRTQYPDARPVADALHSEALAVLPLLTETGTLGYLVVMWTHPREITPLEREYLEAITETTSRGLERARLREAEKRERERIETLQAVTALLAAALTPQQIGDIVTERVCDAVGSDGVAVSLVDDDRRMLEIVAMVGYPDDVCDRYRRLPLDGRTTAADVVRVGRPIVIRDLKEYAEQYPEFVAEAERAGAVSWLTWPLRVGTTNVGVLVFMWREAQRFDAGRLSFVATVAELVAQALVRARVYADEHAIATVLQRAVMPKATPQIPGFDVGAAYRSAGAAGMIGGDWYDALALPKGGVYVALGDVVGHGITAAEDMAQLRNAGRTLAIEGHQPARLLAELARVATSGTHGQYATMTVAIFEPDALFVGYGTAGHPPIFVLRARTGTVEALSASAGPPLGVIDHAAYVQGDTLIEPGDVVLLYSDGLIERRDEDVATGIARVAAALGEYDGQPLDVFCEQLISKLSPQPQFDDICVLAVTRRDLP